MVELVGGAGFDDAKFVCHPAEGSERGAKRGTGFAVLFELKLRPKNGCIGLDEGVALVADNGFGKRGALKFGEVGFGVEELELGRRTGHEEVDDSLGARFDLRGFGFEISRVQVLGEERGGGDLAEANTTFAEEVAS